MKKKNCILGEEEDLKKRRDKIISVGKEKIFNGNEGRNGWMRKKGRKKKIGSVRTRFVTNRNSVGFARKMAQTTSFVERGYERLGLGHQAVGFSWCSCMVKLSSPLESSSWRWAGRLWFLAIFPASSFGATIFLLYSPS